MSMPQPQSSHPNQDPAMPPLPADKTPDAPLPIAQPAIDSMPDTMSPEQALQQFTLDPIGFVKTIVDAAATQHLASMKEEAELRGALNVARKSNPEFARFEPFILQEVVSLLQGDMDGSIEPWDKLLEHAMANFQKKFKETIEGERSKGNLPAPEIAPEPPYMESVANRALIEEPPSFTREQISKMSLQDFLKNEAAINSALKAKRIK